jgi:iron complex outermembrane receptor protein
VSGRPGDSLTNYVNLPGFHDTASGLQSSFYLKQYGLTATATAELSDSATIKSITGFTQTKYNTVSDLDGTPYVVLDLLQYPIHSKQFSEEFQVYGDAMDNRLKWIAGAYYYDGKGDQVSNASVLAALAPPALRGFNPQGPLPSKNTSVSAFAQVTYAVADNLRLTAGVRHVSDKRKITYSDHIAVGSTPPGTYLVCNMANAPGDPNPANCIFKDSASFKYTPWTIGLDYKPSDDSLVYAKVTKGFRSGAFGINGPAATLPSATVTPAQAATANAFALANFAPVAPERLVSYEAGAKLQFMDNRLRLNGAAYWSNYDNIQLTVNLPQPPGCATCTPPAVLQNSGKAEIWGGELEMTALVGPAQIDASAGYTHPKYVEGVSLGQPVINVSKWNWAVSGSLPFDLSMGTLTLGATYSYRSKAFYYPVSPGNSAAAAVAALSQKGFGLIDARASFEFANTPVVVTVFGANLANKKYTTSATNFAPPLSFAVNWPGAPRTYGVSLKYSY